MKVELMCRVESAVVALIETPGPLDAATIRKGLSTIDVARAPLAKKIEDGTQLVCRRCGNPLWFRAGDGQLTAALPGSAEARQ